MVMGLDSRLSWLPWLFISGDDSDGSGQQVIMASLVF